MSSVERLTITLPTEMATKLRDALPAVNTPPQAKSFVRHYVIGCVRTTPNVGILKPCGKLFVQGWRAAPLFPLKKSLQPCVPATPRPDNDALHSSRRTGRPYRDRRLYRDRQPGSGAILYRGIRALIFSAIAVRPDSFPARPGLGEGLRVACHHRISSSSRTMQNVSKCCASCTERVTFSPF